MASSIHTLHAATSHTVWDRSLSPAITVAPGAVVEVAPQDASGGQLTEASTADDIAHLDFGKVNPVVGPIAIDGAEPGDAIKITFIDIVPSGWGWTANIPGFGLLADDFPSPVLHHWRYQPTGSALWSTIAKVPVRPFCGTIGLAPAEPGAHSVVPPRRVGGNMDIRDLTAGAELYLPVEVAGGLLSIGDPHAAQGDGEVCGTAIESPAIIAVQVDLVRGANLRFPRFSTPGPVTRHVDVAGYEVTCGIGPDLMAAARDAVRSMIDLLASQLGLAAVDAYMLCSVCADLRISEIVDQPNWVVSLYMPRAVFS
jgi:acetamidase/formamidase